MEDPHTLGAKSYDEWQTSNEKVMAHVRSVLMTSSALFIGYGMGDPHFKATLAWVRKVTKNDVRMFALMHKTAAGVLKAQASVNNLHAVSMDSNTAYVNSLSQIKLEWLKLAGNISKIK